MISVLLQGIHPPAKASKKATAPQPANASKATASQPAAVPKGPPYGCAGCRQGPSGCLNCNPAKKQRHEAKILASGGSEAKDDEAKDDEAEDIL